MCLALTMANGSTAASTAKVYVYEGPSDTQQGNIDVMAHMVNDSFARVMSTSWGVQEGPAGSDWMNAADYIYPDFGRAPPQLNTSFPPSSSEAEEHFENPRVRRNILIGS
jgi:hypothetical protein